MHNLNWRGHQKKIDAIAARIIAGMFPKKHIVLDCVPGGGKTGAATHFANRLLSAGLINSVLWLVPRLSLSAQVVEAFATGFGSVSARDITAANPDALLPVCIPGLPAVVGHVTTYQAIAAKTKHGQTSTCKKFLDALASHNSLLICDEVQFLNDREFQVDAELPKGWYSKVNQLSEACRYRLVMSGALWRTDGLRVPFVGYERRPDGLSYPLPDITYSLREAVADKAILPIEWKNRGGIATYRHRGVKTVHDLLAPLSEEDSRAIRTCLADDDYCTCILDEMVQDWRERVKNTYPTRMLVMAENISAARRWADYLERAHHIPCVLATSNERGSSRKMEAFRKRQEGQCLVTVAMAYVGFDCPDLSHLAYLSSIRAPAWMLQSFNRISRVDSRAPIAYDLQHAFVFAPDDAPMRQFLDWLRTEQEMGIADRRRGRAEGVGGPLPEDFQPLDAEVGLCAIESLHGRIDPETEVAIAEFVRRCPEAADLPRSKLHGILKAAEYRFSRNREQRSA